MWLFAGFLALPLIEIALFVTLGAWLGLWLTLAVVLGTAVAGVVVIRRQGAHAMEGLRQATRLGRDPLGQVADSGFVMAAGVLLILPGFLTDTLGLLLLVPPLRRLVVRSLSSRVVVHHTGPARQGPVVIDGEYFEIGSDPSADAPAGRPPSGWTRH
jgi:UPF0716 protein FxsA